MKKNNKKDFLNISIVDEKIINKLENYDLKEYINDVKNFGLEKTWNYICEFVLNYTKNHKFLNINNFAELYEMGLAIQNKDSKKKSGQYYTPDDVALVLCKWLEKCEGKNICDVACGTGKLILTYLDLIGVEKAKKLIIEGKIYLYDFDPIALKVCKIALSVKYGNDICNNIHFIQDDFLNKKISLPENCKVISNPPYASIKNIEKNWEQTTVLKETKELYSCFMEKIFKQSNSAVIITPFSFISGKKFFH